MNKFLLNIKGDKPLWVIFVLLVSFSFLPVYSAASNLAYLYGDGNTFNYLTIEAHNDQGNTTTSSPNYIGKNQYRVLNQFTKIYDKFSDAPINPYSSLKIKFKMKTTLVIPEEVPEDYVLIEVKDMLSTDNFYIYRGWMISSAPDVTPLEHPIYDLWLIECT